MKIELREKTVEGCTSVIVAPEKAVEEPGYILTLTEDAGASSKHKFHAMAQMAYFQFQDDELDVERTMDEIVVVCKDKKEVLRSGVLLCRKDDGDFQVIASGRVNVKKLLEAVYRFCTRWVRLDI